MFLLFNCITLPEVREIQHTNDILVLYQDISVQASISRVPFQAHKPISTFIPLPIFIIRYLHTLNSIKEINVTGKLFM